MSKAVTPPGRYSSLCRPEPGLSCFLCCPPIRAQEYDHWDYRRELDPMLKQNRLDRLAEIDGGVIDGKSCWGLGYLDAGEMIIGCLLHPAQNDGRDLRDQTGYGDKCRREVCREVRIFDNLPDRNKYTVLTLAKGLTSFEYSSHKQNPMFKLLRWGPLVIERLAETSPEGLIRKKYQADWRLLAEDLSPARDRFIIEKILERRSAIWLRQKGFLSKYRGVVDRIANELKPVTATPIENRPFVHQLDLPESFAWFMRRALNRPRSTQSQADRIRLQVEAAIDSLR